MKSEHIKQILKKYFDGESSLREESVLRKYFMSNEVDDELLPFRDLFSGLEELKPAENNKLEDTLMDFIMESELEEKNKYRRLWQTVTGIAAALLITLLVFNYTNDRSSWKDTYSDPEQAYAEASKTLHYMAEKYQKGIAQLQTFQKLDKAVQPMNKGVEAINKGFNELEEIKQINTEP